MINWIDFLNKLPDQNTSFIVKHDSSIYLGIREKSESIWCVEELSDDNVTGMNWQIDWDLGGFKWCYQDNIHESYRKYLQPERSKREDDHEYCDRNFCSVCHT
jgi:hypothetical protein